MKKLPLFLIMLIFFNCQNEDERCGQIIQKVTQNAVYYFVLQTDKTLDLLEIRIYHQSQTMVFDKEVYPKKFMSPLKWVTNTVLKSKNLLSLHL